MTTKITKSLNTTKLVKKQVQVHGKDGKIFTRMQWVDPSTDQPAFHQRKMSSEEKKQYSQKLRNKEELDPPENITPFQPKLAIDKQDRAKDYTPEQLDFMRGRVGTIDLENLTQGTPLYKDKQAIQFSTNFMSQHPATKNHIQDISVQNHIASVFKNVTKEGIESVFSDPKGKYTASLTQMSAGYNSEHGYIELCIDLEWSDKKGDYMGYTSRTLHRDKNGNLHVYNDITQIETKHQGKGVAQNEQERSEQLWRYLSDGNPVHESLEANINVGVYAWALKGYDFIDEESLDTAKKELTTFLEKNNMNVKDKLEQCGYTSIDQLKHSWQFASLTDGTIYDANEIMDNPDSEIKKKTKKGIPLGKAFMLGGKTAWNGEKILNGGTQHEEISELYKKSKKKKGR